MKTMTAVLLSLVALAMTLFGCSGNPGDTNSESEIAPKAADASLQAIGVHYFDADGTAEQASLTFYDRDRNVIGGAQVKKGTESHSEVAWKGVRWELSGTEDAPTLSKDGIRIDVAATEEFNEASNVTDLVLDQADLPSHQAQAQKCVRHGGKCGLRFFGRGSARCCGRNVCAGSALLSRRCAGSDFNAR